jgi:hypothetical protein
MQLILSVGFLSMNKPPEKLDDAMTLFWTILENRHLPTGNTKHFINGNNQRVFWGRAMLTAYKY